MKKLVSLIAAMSLTACASVESPKPVIDNSHQQLVVVVANDSDAIDATLYRFEKMLVAGNNKASNMLWCLAALVLLGG